MSKLGIAEKNSIIDATLLRHQYPILLVFLCKTYRFVISPEIRFEIPTSSIVVKTCSRLGSYDHYTMLSVIHVIGSFYLTVQARYTRMCTLYLASLILFFISLLATKCCHMSRKGRPHWWWWWWKQFLHELSEIKFNASSSKKISYRLSETNNLD